MSEEEPTKVRYKLFTKRQKQRFLEKRGIVQENYADFVKQIKARSGSNAAVFKNGGKIKYLYRRNQIYLNFSAMVNLTVLFLSLTCYEFDFDPKKDKGAAEVLYILLSVLVVFNVVVSWMEDKMEDELETEIKGGFKEFSAFTYWFRIIFKICRCFLLFGAELGLGLG